MDMINHICHHFVESYCQLILHKKIITKYIAKNTIVTAMCACIRNTNVCFFPNVCMQIKLVNILTYVQILSY